MRSIREFLETIGARGLIIGTGFVFSCLTAASLAYDEGNHQAAILWCLVLALLAVMAYLLWCLNEMLDLGERSAQRAAHIAWDLGYYQAQRDELHDMERADNPYDWPDRMDYEGRGED